jgi:excisionase family DNA binding protein
MTRRPDWKLREAIEARMSADMERGAAMMLSEHDVERIAGRLAGKIPAKREAPSVRNSTQLGNVEHLMSIEIIARRLGVHPDTVKRLARSGELECYRVTKKLIKFDEAQFQRFLQKVRREVVRLPLVHRFPLLARRVRRANTVTRL